MDTQQQYFINYYIIHIFLATTFDKSFIIRTWLESSIIGTSEKLNKLQQWYRQTVDLIRFHSIFFRNKLYKSKGGPLWHCSRLHSSMLNYFGSNLISTQFWIHILLPQVEWLHQNHFVSNVYNWHIWIHNYDHWWRNNPDQKRANLCNMLHDPLLWCNSSIHGCFYDFYDISYKVCKSLDYF